MAALAVCSELFFEITGFSVDRFGLLRQLWSFFLSNEKFLTPVQLLPSMIATGLPLYL